MTDQNPPAQNPAQNPAQGPAQNPAQGPAAVRDEVAQAGRERLAEWLTAEAPTPDLATSAEELAEWSAYQVEEFVLFVPPGYANLMYLVSEHGITSYQPSMQSIQQAMSAARSQS
jgi:hypothetical protein